MRADNGDVKRGSYVYSFTGRGKPRSLHIDDSNYNDNSGSLTATIQCAGEEKPEG